MNSRVRSASLRRHEQTLANTDHCAACATPSKQPLKPRHVLATASIARLQRQRRLLPLHEAVAEALDGLQHARVRTELLAQQSDQYVDDVATAVLLAPNL